jgi:4-amino-4-deoxy-L-arabinose transferase-like glycosyltransferase
MYTASMTFNALKTALILFLISILALSIRVYRIDSSPQGALIDEAHFGYLAHSLLETGKDEHGVSYPIIFRGFGDNKLPAGAYLLMPVVKLFGLSNTTIRIPSLIAGTLLTLAMYWLVRELGLKQRYGFLAALLTAIAPWPFFLSRFGFESNLGLFFFTLGLAALLKGHNQIASHKKVLIQSLSWLVVASLSFAATWYSYISYRPVTLALLVLFWIGSWWQHRKLIFKPAAVSIVSLAIFVAPLLIGPAASANSTRFNQVGILSDPSTTLLVNENRTFCTMQLPRLWCYAIWNKASVLGPVLASRFLESFAPQFMATKGEGENIFLTIQGFGQFYLVMYPLMIIGLGWLLISQLPLFSKLHKQLPVFPFSHWVLLIAGLLASPIPTILVGTPQPVRISPLLPFLVVATVIGAVILEKLLTFEWLKKLVFAGLAVVLAYQAASFLTNYYSVHTIKNDYYYQSYLPGLYSFLSTINSNTQIYIKPFYSDPLMFYAYYTKMDPALYQQQAVLGELEASGFQHTVGLGSLKTTSDSIAYVSCKEHEQGKQAVFVTNEQLPYPILYKGMSASNVHTFVYVYDATAPKMVEQCTN